MLHPGQREPTEREKRSNAVPYERRWSGAAYPQPFGMPYYAVGLFLPRSISDFLWERDEEPYPHGSLRGYRRPQRRERNG